MRPDLDDRVRSGSTAKATVEALRHHLKAFLRPIPVGVQSRLPGRPAKHPFEADCAGDEIAQPDVQRGDRDDLDTAANAENRWLLYPLKVRGSKGSSTAHAMIFMIRPRCTKQADAINAEICDQLD